MPAPLFDEAIDPTQNGGVADLGNLQVMSPMDGEVEQDHYAQRQPTLPRQDTSQIEGFQSKKSELRKRPYEVPDEHPVHHRSPSPVVLEPEGAGTEMQEVLYDALQQGKGSGLNSGGMKGGSMRTIRSSVHVTKRISPSFSSGGDHLIVTEREHVTESGAVVPKSEPEPTPLQRSLEVAALRDSLTALRPATVQDTPIKAHLKSEVQALWNDLQSAHTEVPNTRVLAFSEIESQQRSFRQIA